MKMMHKGSLVLLALLLLSAAFGCKTSDPVGTNVSPSDAPSVEQLDLSGEDEPSPESVVFSAPDYSVRSNSAPTDHLTPTRAPIAGDVTTNFPNYDTGADADYSYQSDELRIAVRRYEDEDIKQVYYVADIWLRNISAFRAGFGNGAHASGREDGEKFAAREHAVFGVNGSFNQGLVFHDGTQYRDLEKGNPTHNGVIALYKDGTMKTFRVGKDKLDTKAEASNGMLHAWQFGPVLVQNGEIAGQFAAYGTRHPRNMIGYFEPGHYVIVTCDGRSKKSIGMNQYEMAVLMKTLGCKDAMNLDGGTSAIMTFMGKCISIPSGVDKDGDGKAGRNLVDMILFAEYDAEGNAPALEDIPAEKVKGF